ncbi:hypothetical protein GEMRC1_004696 [Eukaryota sp. GEM-RC1]
MTERSIGNFNLLDNLSISIETNFSSHIFNFLNSSPDNFKQKLCSNLSLKQFNFSALCCCVYLTPSVLLQFFSFLLHYVDNFPATGVFSELVSTLIILNHHSYLKQLFVSFGKKLCLHKLKQSHFFLTLSLQTKSFQSAQVLIENNCLSLSNDCSLSCFCGKFHLSSSYKEKKTKLTFLLVYFLSLNFIDLASFIVDSFNLSDFFLPCGVSVIHVLSAMNRLDFLKYFPSDVTFFPPNFNQNSLADLPLLTLISNHNDIVSDLHILLDIMSAAHLTDSIFNALVCSIVLQKNKWIPTLLQRCISFLDRPKLMLLLKTVQKSPDMSSVVFENLKSAGFKFTSDHAVHVDAPELFSIILNSENSLSSASALFCSLMKENIDLTSLILMNNTSTNLAAESLKFSVFSKNPELVQCCLSFLSEQNLPVIKNSRFLSLLSIDDVIYKILSSLTDDRSFDHSIALQTQFASNDSSDILKFLFLYNLYTNNNEEASTILNNSKFNQESLLLMLNSCIIRNNEFLSKQIIQMSPELANGLIGLAPLPLQIAFFIDSLPIAKLLIDNGADIDAISKELQLASK